MPVRDDAREREMRQLFNLQIAPDRRRSDVDAYLDFEGVRLEFELKSTTSKSVSTVRDFGLDHVEKWRNKHWLFGFYARDGDELLHCPYASPAQMDPWIAEKAAYVRPDQTLAQATLGQ